MPDITVAEIESIIADIRVAKTLRDFESADAFRSHLDSNGITLEYTAHGISWKRKRDVSYLDTHPVSN